MKRENLDLLHKREGLEIIYDSHIITHVLEMFKFTFLDNIRLESTHFHWKTFFVDIVGCLSVLDQY